MHLYRASQSAQSAVIHIGSLRATQSWHRPGRRWGRHRQARQPTGSGRAVTV